MPLIHTTKMEVKQKLRQGNLSCSLLTLWTYERERESCQEEFRKGRGKWKEKPKPLMTSVNSCRFAMGKWWVVCVLKGKLLSTWGNGSWPVMFLQYWRGVYTWNCPGKVKSWDKSGNHFCDTVSKKCSHQRLLPLYILE